jgi:hypothetical protein
MDNDSLAIMHCTPLLAPGEEGLKDAIVIEAIYQAAASGRKEMIVGMACWLAADGWRDAGLRCYGG